MFLILSYSFHSWLNSSSVLGTLLGARYTAIKKTKISAVSETYSGAEAGE